MQNYLTEILEYISCPVYPYHIPFIQHDICEQAGRDLFQKGVPFLLFMTPNFPDQVPLEEIISRKQKTAESNRLILRAHELTCKIIRFYLKEYGI